MLRSYSSVIDRFILRRCRVVDLSVYSGHSTEPTAHPQLLPRKYLSGYSRPKSIKYFPPFFSTHAISTELCSLDELTSVHELGDWSYLCSARYVATAVDTKIPQDHSAALQFAFFFEGVEKFLLPWAVEALPTLLHVSLFLFFAGLVVFLYNVNLTICKLVLSWVGVCTALYGCIAFVLIFRHDSPYHTPLSLLAWHIVTAISYVIFRVIRRVILLDYFSGRTYRHFRHLEKRYRKLLVQGMQKAVEETALNLPSEIDTCAFLWTFDCLDEDHELERFFSGLPGFRSSKVVDDPLPGLTYEQRWKLSTALVGLLDRTFSSDLLPLPVKHRRAIICAKAIDPAQIPGAIVILDFLLSKDQYRGALSAEVLQIVRGWGNNNGENTSLIAQATTSYILARAQWRDDSWFTLASNELGVLETILRDHTANGDSLSPAIVIHIFRQQFSLFRNQPWLRD